jgi:hypothetical protein
MMDRIWTALMNTLTCVVAAPLCLVAAMIATIPLSPLNVPAMIVTAHALMMAGLALGLKIYRGGELALRGWPRILLMTFMAFSSLLLARRAAQAIEGIAPTTATGPVEFTAMVAIVSVSTVICPSDEGDTDLL